MATQGALFGGDGHDLPTVAQLLPDRLSLQGLQEASVGCTACPIHEHATQTVFGEGLVRSDVMVVGEQPGDQEDRQGRPFVGPAGGVLDEGLIEAGFDRDQIYVTNVVKHFKWEPRGKRRIHQRPNRSEIAACRPWLEAELEVVEPTALVLLGATAAQALLGPSFRVTRQRGEPVDSDLAPIVMATVHPSSVLRADDREAAMTGFVADLRAVRSAFDSAA